MELDRRILARTQWFLDFDGSVCPHLEVWQERNYDPNRIYQLVSRLHAQSAGLFWNTGRRPDSLAGVHPSFLEFNGYFIHGSVRWDARRQEIDLLGPPMAQEVADEMLKRLRAHRDLRLEVKPTGLRVAPFDPVSIPKLHAFMDSPDFFTPAGWQWTVGARGAELLAEGFNKATPLKREVQDDKIPIAVGDDLFDSPAFEEALRRGGFAVVVGEHCGFSTQIPHQSWQMIYCDNSEEVLKKIERLL